MLSGSGKNVVSFGYLDARTFPERNGGGFYNYSRKSGSGDFKFGSSKGGSEFVTFTEINIEYVSG